MLHRDIGQSAREDTYIKHNSMRQDEQRQRPEQSSGRQSCSRASGYGRSRGMAPIEETYRLLLRARSSSLFSFCPLSPRPSSSFSDSLCWLVRPSLSSSLYILEGLSLIPVYETLRRWPTSLDHSRIRPHSLPRTLSVTTIDARKGSQITIDVCGSGKLKHATGA